MRSESLKNDFSLNIVISMYIHFRNFQENKKNFIKLYSYKTLKTVLNQILRIDE